MRQVINTAPDGVAQHPDSASLASENALVLTGGGARAAYQAGVLQYIAEAFPTVRFPILTGVSAGAINAAQLANHRGTFPEAVDNLVAWWGALRPEHVFEPSSSVGFLLKLLRRGGREEIGEALPRYGLVDNAPLRAYLEDKLQAEDGQLAGVGTNIRLGHVTAFAITTIDYGTGQTVTWVQGRHIKEWERPNRVGINTTLTIDHIMASSALPFLFPAVRIGNSWYGDGGIRLAHPLAPAISLGASRILSIATRYERSRSEADEPSIQGYPPAAQIFSLLMNAVFLDTLEQDALVLERINRLVTELPRPKRQGLRPIKLLMMRPSAALGKLAGEYEPHLTGVLRLLSRALGSHDTTSPNWLSMLLFLPEYTHRLIGLGHLDAARQHNRIADFLAS